MCYKFFHSMKKIILSSIFGVALLTALVVKANGAGYDDPLPNSYCYNGNFKIYINPKGVSGNTHVRIDNLSNPWNPQSPQPGDVVLDNFKGSAYVGEGEVGQEYSWWIHTSDGKGNFAPAKGGRVFCRIGQPQDLKTSYDYPYVKISWAPVKGAVRYAVRVDNQITPWNPENMEDGDHKRESLKENEMLFKAARGRKISWWVHAVDKWGNYSTAAVQEFTTPR